MTAIRSDRNMITSAYRPTQNLVTYIAAHFYTQP